MALNEFDTRDYVSEIRERYTEQFKDKPKFDRYVRTLLAGAIELQLVLKDLMQKRTLDEAEGVQLDIIGDIVGQPRTLYSVASIPYFGFDTSIGAETYGDLNAPNVGGVWYSLGQPLTGNVLLDDNTYRMFIKAKIKKNVARGTPEDVIDAVKFIFDTDNFVLVEDATASFRLDFGFTLTDTQKLLLDTVLESGFTQTVLPKPAGVSFSYTDV